MSEEIKQIRIDLSGQEGLAPRYYGDLPFSSSNRALRTIGTSKMYADGLVNPRTRLGYLTPASNTPTNVSNTLGAVLGSVKNDTVNENLYFFERGNIIHELTSFTDKSLSIRRTLEVGSIGTDLEIYTVNGVRQLFYSYRGNNTGGIGIYDLSFAYDDLWLSTTVSGAFTTGKSNNHKMVVADNGFMYVLDGSFVHKVDGTTAGGANGTVTANVLSFPATTQLIDGLDLGGFLWIALMESTRDLGTNTSNTALFNESCGIYVWDRSSTVVSSVDFIPIRDVKEVRNLFVFQNNPACFTVSSSRYTELRMYNGRTFDVVQELGAGAFPKFADSVYTTGDIVVWLGNDGIIYTYGKPFSKAGFNALYKIGDMTGHVSSTKSLTTGGVLIGASANESVSVAGENQEAEAYYLSFRDSTPAYFIKKFYPNSTAIESTARYPTADVFYTLAVELPKLSKVISITLHYPPISATGTDTVMKVDLYFNQSTTSWGQTTLTKTDGTIGYKRIAVGKANVNYIQIGLSWNTGVRLDFAITPSHATVEYTITGKKI